MEQEKEWELKLGAAVGLCNQLEQQIEDIHGKARSSLDSRAFHSADDARSWGLYRSMLSQSLQRLTMDLQKARKEMEKVREQYLEASKKRKGLDKLKEKKKKLYHRYVLQEEQKEMDQLTAQKFAREEH